MKTYMIPSRNVMKGATRGPTRMAKGGEINMDSPDVPQHKRMAAGCSCKQGSSRK